jgi:DNA polymerase I-like protein with 3'-5' exonuclease and polymerase domains
MSIQENRSIHANRIRLGKLLEKYNGRILDGIRMTIDKTSGHPSRYRYAFVRLEDEPEIIVKYPRYRPLGWEEVLRAKQPSGWKQIIQKEEEKRNKEEETRRKRQQDNPESESSKVEELTPCGPQSTREASVSSAGQISSQSRREIKTRSPRTKNLHGGVELSNPLGCEGDDLDEGTDFSTTQAVSSTGVKQCRRENYMSSLAETAASDPRSQACQSVSPSGQNPTETVSKTKERAPHRTKNAHSGADYFYFEGRLDAKMTVRTDRLTTPLLAIDIETYVGVGADRRGALDPWKGEIRLVTLADGTGAVECFDLCAGGLPEEIRVGLERCSLIVHNACFDLLFLKVRLGIVPVEVFCTMTASRLLLPSRSESHSLGETLERYLGVKLPKEHGGSDWGAFVLTDSQIAYVKNDVRYLHKLEAKLRAELELSQLEEVFELEMKLIPIVVAMEYQGFAIDRDKLQQMRIAAATVADLLADEVRQAFNSPTLNLDSPPQLLEAFKADGVNIEATDETTLSAFEDKRARLLLDYRGQAKLEDSTKGLLKAVGADGRIHARFSPTGSLSGRFSSQHPNLQNISRGPLRSCFIASSSERSLIVADYSQIELRIGAHFAADEVMLEAFRAKKDLHRATAAVVLSKPLSEVTKADRQLAKAVNFGFLYGQGPKGFRQYARTEYGIVLSLEEAAKLRDRFFARYGGLSKWHQQAWEKAQQGVSEARTVLGRLLLEQGDGRDWDRFQLHTSYRVSGSAADVLKVAMVKTAGMLPSDVHMVATVHDELIFDSPSAEAPQYCGMIRAAMEEAFTEVFGSELPIEVEAKVCANWAEK